MLHSLKAIQSYKSGNTPEAQQLWQSTAGSSGETPY